VPPTQPAEEPEDENPPTNENDTKLDAAAREFRDQLLKMRESEQKEETRATPAGQKVSKPANPAFAFHMFSDSPTEDVDLPDRRGGVENTESTDAEGYYKVSPGEHFDNGKYIAINAVGQGVFSSVFKCKKVSDGAEVALKISCLVSARDQLSWTDIAVHFAQI